MADIGVVGGTGLVGQEILRLLDARLEPAHRLVPIASARSAGRDLNPELALRRELPQVLDVRTVNWTAFDTVFFSAGAELSRSVAPVAAAAGCLVIDNTSAFRHEPGVPLVVPEVNGELLRQRPAGNIVANPNCSTIQLVRVLAPLHRAVGLRRVVVSTYQAASGGGLRGLRELADGSARNLATTTHTLPGVLPPPATVQHGKFGPPLTFNLIPQIGPLDENGIAHEERKIRRESRVILNQPDLDIHATAVRVPVFHCHSEAVWLELDRPMPADRIAAYLSTQDGIRVHTADHPMPAEVIRRVEDRARVHVGRIRGEPQQPHIAMLWIVADNVWVGAALNAVSILSLVHATDWSGAA